MSASFNGLEYFVTLTPNFKHSFKADFASFFYFSLAEPKNTIVS